MGPIFDVPTWDDIRAELTALLFDILQWLVNTGTGNTVLVLSMLLIVAGFASTFGSRDPLLQTTAPWED